MTFLWWGEILRRDWSVATYYIFIFHPWTCLHCAHIQSVFDLGFQKASIVLTSFRWHRDDCVVCTYTLHLMFQYQRTRSCYKLKPTHEHESYIYVYYIIIMALKYVIRNSHTKKRKTSSHTRSPRAANRISRACSDSGCNGTPLTNLS